MTALHAATAKALADADLDPAYVESVARATVEEDLAGGVDVTSVATVPVGLVGIAAFVPRAAGVVAGEPSLVLLQHKLFAHGMVAPVERACVASTQAAKRA